MNEKKILAASYAYGGRRPPIILKSKTPEIRFPAFWEVIVYRKAHHKLEVWERLDQD